MRLYTRNVGRAWRGRDNQRPHDSCRLGPRLRPGREGELRCRWRDGKHHQLRWDPQGAAALQLYAASRRIWRTVTISAHLENRALLTRRGYTTHTQTCLAAG